MMTIKVIQREEREFTSIFSARQLQYARIGYCNKAHFIETYKECSLESSVIEMCMMFPKDDETYQVPGDEQKPHKTEGDMTEFIKIDFLDEDKSGRRIFAQHATIYIMQDGQTVDKIYC